MYFQSPWSLHQSRMHPSRLAAFECSGSVSKWSLRFWEGIEYESATQLTWLISFCLLLTALKNKNKQQNKTSGTLNVSWISKHASSVPRTFVTLLPCISGLVNSLEDGLSLSLTEKPSFHLTSKQPAFETEQPFQRHNSKLKSCVRRKTLTELQVFFWASFNSGV